MRASMPATAPQGAKDSKWPRNLSCAKIRGKYISASSVENSQSRMRAKRIVRRVPRRRRIDDQQRAALLAISRRHQQCARPHVVLARKRRDAQEVEIVRAAQREQSGPLDLRADQIVVAERRPVVAVRIGVHVGGREAARRIQRAVRPLHRQLPGESNQLRTRQHALDIAVRLPALSTAAGISPDPPRGCRPGCARAAP